jgi:hypothetical protein
MSSSITTTTLKLVDAVDRRLDAHLAQIVARALEARLLLGDARALRRHLLLALGQRRLGGPDVVLGPVQRLLRRQLLLPQVALPLEGLLRLLELHPRRLHRLAQLGERRLGRPQRGRAAVDARAQRARVDLQQELPDRDPLPLVHGELDHPAGSVRADVDQALRLDRAGGRDDGLEVALSDRLDRDLGRRVAGEPQVRRHDRRGDDEDPGGDEHVPSGHLRS